VHFDASPAPELKIMLFLAAEAPQHSMLTNKIGAGVSGAGSLEPLPENNATLCDFDSGSVFADINATYTQESTYARLLKAKNL
jgi:hypothetical protein